MIWWSPCRLRTSAKSRASQALQRALALASGKDEAALVQYRSMLDGLRATGGL